MAHARARVRAVVCVASLALLLVGCAGSSEPSADATTAGSASTSPLPGLPDGWPMSLALPEGGTVTNVVSVDQPGSAGWTVTVRYDQAPEEVAAALTASLRSAGFVEETTVSSGDLSMLAFQGGGYRVAVTVGPKGSNGARVAVTVLEE